MYASRDWNENARIIIGANQKWYTQDNWVAIIYEKIFLCETVKQVKIIMNVAQI